MSDRENAALARRVYDAFNRRDFDSIISYSDDKIELVLVPFDMRYHGTQGFHDFLTTFVSGFSDIVVRVTNQVSGGDQVVSEYIASGTHDGPLMTPAGSVPATGRSVEYPVVEVWRFRDGKVASLHNYFDAATVLRQLGVLTS